MRDPDELRAAGRMMGAVWLVGGLSGMLWYLIPGADRTHWVLGLGSCTLSVGIGLACLLGPWHRLSPGWFRAGAVATLVVIPVVIAINGGADSPTVLYLFLATVVFGYYLPTREALGFLAAGLLVPATPMLYDPEALGAPYIARMVLTAPIYGAVGIVAMMAKRQLVAWRNQARDQALRDPLTGLPNRRALSELLTAAATDEHAPGPIALVMIDLDDFKQANTRLGHVGGDRLLRHVATLLRRVVRDGDLVARLGGDEFAVLVFGLGAEGLEGLADRVVQTIRTSTEIHGITASVGVALLEGRDSEIDAVLRAADHEMRQAKLAGKDRWRLVAA